MPATHLTASMRALRAHLKQRHVSAAAAREAVLSLARRYAINSGVTREDDRLAAALTKATGVPLAELAEIAKGWPA